MIASFVKGFASFLGRHIRGGRLLPPPPSPPIFRDIQPTNSHKSHPPTSLPNNLVMIWRVVYICILCFFHIEQSAATTLALVHAKGEIFDYLITEW